MQPYARHYIVDAEALPPVFLKVLKVRRLLDSGECKTIDAAVKEIGLSRSAYYKYKDAIRPFFEIRREHIVTFSGVLSDKAGVLSLILRHFALSGANILTIHQDIPSGGQAAVTISARVDGLTVNLDEFVAAAQKIEGILRFSPLARQ